MAKFNVTLKAALKKGDIYWVAKVNATDEDAAMAVAEALFFKELDNPGQWSFDEADVEAL